MITITTLGSSVSSREAQRFGTVKEGTGKENVSCVRGAASLSIWIIWLQVFQQWSVAASPSCGKRGG